MSGDPWDQDAPPLEDLDDDLLDDKTDEDSDELGIDYHTGVEIEGIADDSAAPVATPVATPVEHNQSHAQVAQPRKLRHPGVRPGRRKAGDRYRLRAMSPRMQQQFPHVDSMLITLRDGSQILFVRKGR